MTADAYICRTAVYRLYDATDQLLYVGIGPDPEARWYVHAREKPWWPDVARKSVVWHDSRSAALAEETQSIETEGPRHNIRGGQVPHYEPTAPGVHIPAQVARLRLGDLMAEVEATDEPVAVTRHGKVSGYLVPAAWYLKAARAPAEIRALREQLAMLAADAQDSAE